MPKFIKLYSSNICSLWYVNYTSISLFKKTALEFFESKWKSQYASGALILALNLKGEAAGETHQTKVIPRLDV